MDEARLLYMGSGSAGVRGVNTDMRGVAVDVDSSDDDDAGSERGGAEGSEGASDDPGVASNSIPAPSKPPTSELLLAMARARNDGERGRRELHRYPPSHSGGGQSQPSSITIDRIRPARTYIVCISVCAAANLLN